MQLINILVDFFKKVQCCGVSDEVEGQERDVCGGLVGEEPVAVADLHDFVGAGGVVAHADHERGSSLHF